MKGDTSRPCNARAEKCTICNVGKSTQSGPREKHAKSLEGWAVETLKERLAFQFSGVHTVTLLTLASAVAPHLEILACFLLRHVACYVDGHITVTPAFHHSFHTRLSSTFDFYRSELSILKFLPFSAEEKFN